MSNEFLGERRKGLEEAYFAKHNRELIARLRKGNAPLHAVASPDVAQPVSGRDGEFNACTRTCNRVAAI